MSEQKPREFYVDPESLDDECGVHDAFDKHPGQGPLQWQASLVHVIEKSAFDKAVKALRHYALANGGNHPSGNVARNCLKDLGCGNG